MAVTFVLPGWFSAPVTVPKEDVLLLEAATSSSVDPDDVVFAGSVRVIEIPQRGAFTTGNTVFLFRRPAPVRPRPFAYQHTDLSWRRGRRGVEFIDGLVLELADARVAQGALRRRGVATVTFDAYASSIVGIESDAAVAASARRARRSLDRWWRWGDLGIFVGGAVAIAGEMVDNDPVALVGVVIGVVSLVTQIVANQGARRRSATGSRPPEQAS